MTVYYEARTLPVLLPAEAFNLGIYQNTCLLRPRACMQVVHGGLTAACLVLTGPTRSADIKLQGYGLNSLRSAPPLPIVPLLLVYLFCWSYRCDALVHNARKVTTCADSQRAVVPCAFLHHCFLGMHEQHAWRRT
jgi:hypothetical protein